MFYSKKVELKRTIMNNQRRPKIKKDKKWHIATGAGLGMIFGYAIWNSSIGLILGAAVGLIIFTSYRKKNKNSDQ